MVAVVVDHADARRPPAQLEAAVHAAELVERRADRLDGNVQPDAHRNGGRRIQHVVHAGHMQREFAQVLSRDRHAKPAQGLTPSRFCGPELRVLTSPAVDSQLDQKVRPAPGAVGHVRRCTSGSSRRSSGSSLQATTMP